MKALLLAGGLGTRLRPLTLHTPKCLVPIHGVPLLDYWLNLLLPNGIDQILINTHYLPDQVQAHIANSPWRERVVLTYEPNLLGTASTILHNEAFFDGKAFFVAHADNLTRFDVGDFLQTHSRRAPNVVATMMTFDTDDPRSCGIIEQDDEQIVTALHEKVANPPGTLANGAVYIFEPSVLTLMHTLKKDALDISTDILPRLLGKMQSYHNGCYLRDIGNMQSLKLAEKEFSLTERSLKGVIS